MAFMSKMRSWFGSKRGGEKKNKIEVCTGSSGDCRSMFLFIGACCGTASFRHCHYPRTRGVRFWKCMVITASSRRDWEGCIIINSGAQQSNRREGARRRAEEQTDAGTFTMIQREHIESSMENEPVRELPWRPRGGRKHEEGRGARRACKRACFGDRSPRRHGA